MTEKDQECPTLEASCNHRSWIDSLCLDIDILVTYAPHHGLMIKASEDESLSILLIS